MMKFFRKYNKALLAVFMVLLMIVFLGGSALNTLLSPSGDRVVAASAVGTISYLDQRTAEDTRSILLAVAGVDAWWPVQGMVEPLEPVDWVLLTREAKALGLGDNLIAARAMVPDQRGLSRKLRRKPERILQAVGEFAAVQRAANLVGMAAFPSQAEIRSAAHKSLEKVRVAAVMLPAEAFLDQEATFTEAEIQTQFETYRNREAGAGMNFGYYVEPAIKLQYIKIDAGVMTDQVRVANLDRKARAYFDQQREKDPAFRRPADQMVIDEEQEGPKAEISPYLSWDEAKLEAAGIVKRKEAEEAARRIADWIIPYVAQPWLDQSRGDDGYKNTPDSVTTLDYYEAILEDLPRTIAYSDATSIATTEFFDRAGARDVAELGQATFAQPRAGILEAVSTLAFRTQALVPKVPDTEGTVASDYLATFQTSRYPLTDRDGNVYVFRLVDARAGHTPEAVAEVRDRVVADLRLTRAYEQAQARAESLRSCAGSDSLSDAFQSDDELVSLLAAAGVPGGYREPPSFARIDRFLVGRGLTPTTTFVGGGVGQIPSEAVEKLFALADAEDKTTVLELKDRATVMAVEWIEAEAARIEDYEQTRTTLAQQLTASRMQLAIADWLKPDNIRARNGFELVNN